MKILTSFISKENLDSLIDLNYLPIFIIRNMRDSSLLNRYSDTCLHLRELSPSTELLSKFKNNTISVEEYRNRYLVEIVLRNISFSRLITKFSTLNDLTMSSGIVLLGYNENPELCHRRFLAEFMESVTGYKIDEWKRN